MSVVNATSKHAGGAGLGGVARDLLRMIRLCGGSTLTSVLQVRFAASTWISPEASRPSATLPL